MEDRSNQYISRGDNTLNKYEETSYWVREDNGLNKYEETSHMIKAMDSWTKDLQTSTETPSGMFGRVAVIQSGGVTINSKELDVEFVIPFDDNTEANEAEITIYNLSHSTIQALKWNNTITITAGYGNDTGVIFEGVISKVITKWEGVDKKTVINALDDVNLKEREIAEITFAEGTRASTILRTLISMLGLPVACFRTQRDHVYTSETKVSGGLMENIKKYAEVCEISVYIQHRKVHARHLFDGEGIPFTVSADTGLIESPEEFEEDVTTDNYKNTIRGYKFKMLLQHRMAIAAVVTLASQNVSGMYRVRSGTHTFNNSESVTEVEVIDY